MEDIPPEMKIGKFNPKDDECIKENMELLLESVNLSKDENKAKKEIFFLSVEDGHLQKINVIGLWLSQGLEDVRLPCDVAHRGRLLYLSTRNEEFTEEEETIILSFMETEGAAIPLLHCPLSLDGPGRASRSITRGYSNINTRISLANILQWKTRW